MSWSTNLTWEDAKKKSKIMTKIRRFFEDRNIIEVETPIICESTTTDIHLEPFITCFNYKKSQTDIFIQEKYLQTSPEFCMKRLLASGYQSIYQISKAFRNEEQARYHNPEFTILEWYRLSFTQHELMNEVSELLSVVLNCTSAEFVSYKDVFIKYTGIDPLNTSICELLRYIRENDKMSDWLLSETCLDNLLQFILSEFIETKVGQEAPCFIYNFPISQASLAKKSETNPNVAQRFECYFRGIELVNGFCELTDPNEQLIRFNNDNEKRRELGLVERTIDYKFIKALESGIPNCSGVALGIDRLIMLALNKDTIEDVITFCIDRS